MASTSDRAGVSGRSLAMAVIGYAGLAMCITLVFLGMRAVMDVGGACADGGPYVSAQHCPEGSTLALLGGVFGGFGFGALASIGGAGIGGIWVGAPVFAWIGLFGSLGWNFLDYGVFSAPTGAGVDGTWVFCGLLFWAMAAGGLLVLVPLARSPKFAPGSSSTVTLRGPGQARRSSVVMTGGSPVTVSRDGHTVVFSTTTVDGDIPDGLRDRLETLQHQLATARASGQTEASREELGEIAADFGAAIGAALAEIPVAPEARATILTAGGAIGAPAGGTPPGHAAAPGVDAAPGPTTAPGSDGAPGPEFTEGSQALLDRLERLADMRDRGLLGPDEYEVAKARIMTALEGRS
jgi:hypothetical protein